MLTVYLDDLFSDSSEVEETIRGAWNEKVLLYTQTSDSLICCARDKTEEIISCWVKEICEFLNERFYKGELIIFCDFVS